MPAPIVPPKVNQWINSPQSRQTTGQYPLNLCAVLDPAVQKDILSYITREYAWPQIQERQPYEGMWDAVLDMYRIQMKKIDTNLDEASQAGKDQKKEGTGDRAKVSDSVVHDAVERLTDITHFVSFKESLPVQYIVPPYYDNRLADQFYDPLRDRINTMNGLLQWNFDAEDIYRKHLITSRHFYLYGIAFARSEFAFEATPNVQMNNSGQQTQQMQFTRLGTTFDPISIRKLWLNFRLSAYEMNMQPCPFFCEEMPHWNVTSQRYDPDYQPFGYWNLEQIPMDGRGDWMLGSEMESMNKALQDYLGAIKPGTGNSGGATTASLLDDQHNVQMLWHFYPMLPLDEQTGDWKTYKAGPNVGKPVPFKRYIVNSFGTNFTGRQTLLRIQRNFYPQDQIPIYASSHLPDLDSGLYTPSIGYLLWNHYKELVTCLSQYITNKDWINNPPTWHTTASPAANANVNEPGARIPVLGPNDFGWREPLDATTSTAAMLELLRDQAKQTSKSTDALMGQAMGSRTSATEASNAFQASMSAVTTPINLFNYDMMGGYAKRMWAYAAMWMPPFILRELTGQMGMAISPEDMWLTAGVRTNTGSTYIESIVRQQNIQYVLQTGAQDPTINRTEFWKMLLSEMKFPNVEALVNDGGLDKQIAMATKQAIEAFQGQIPVVSPDQDHSVAIQVLTGFLEDQDSVWMTQYRQFAPELVRMIQQHQGFLMLQLQQQLAHAQAGMPIPAAGGQNTMHAAAGANPPAAPQLVTKTENGGAASRSTKLLQQ